MSENETCPTCGEAMKPGDWDCGVSDRAEPMTLRQGLTTSVENLMTILEEEQEIARGYHRHRPDNDYWRGRYDAINIVLARAARSHE